MTWNTFSIRINDSRLIAFRLNQTVSFVTEFSKSEENDEKNAFLRFDTSQKFQVPFRVIPE